MEEEDEPLLSRRAAAVLGVLIIAALILAFYYLFWGMKAGTSMAGINPNVQAAQPNVTEDKWVLSPLVGKYGITQTPVLVIDCRYKLTGSFALDEKRRTVSEGTERNYVGRALCAATSDPVFCSKFGGTAVGLTALQFDRCASGGKIVIYAFHNPACPICEAQRGFLDALRDEFPGRIDLQYICAPADDQGASACSREFLLKKYNA